VPPLQRLTCCASPAAPHLLRLTCCASPAAPAPTAPSA